MNGDVVVGPGVGSNTACVDFDGCVSFVYDETVNTLLMKIHGQ